MFIKSYKLMLLVAFLNLFLYLGCIANDEQNIDKVATLYTRPFTFLAVHGDFNFIIDLATKYPQSSFVVIDHLAFAENTLLPDNVIHLCKTSNLEDLKRLGECEHFDIVYVQDVRKIHYHTRKRDRDELTRALYNLGEHVFINIHQNDMLIKFLTDSGFIELSRAFNEYTILHKCHRINFLKRTQWLEPASEGNFVRHIESTYNAKILSKNYGPKPTHSSWLPGINLMTFKMMNGRVPDMYQIKSEIEGLFKVKHLDWMPNNMIVQGKHLALIDFEDPYSSEAKTVHDDHMLNLVISFATINNKELVPTLFKKILKYCRDKLHPNRRIPLRSLRRRIFGRYAGIR